MSSHSLIPPHNLGEVAEVIYWCLNSPFDPAELREKYQAYKAFAASNGWKIPLN